MKPKWILMGVGGAILLLAVWFFALWSPQGKNIDKAKTDEAVAVAKAGQLQITLAQLKKLEANSSGLEADSAKLAQALPANDQLDQFIFQVNDRAARAGVSLVSIAPQQPGTNVAPGAAAAGALGAPTAIGLQLQVTGDYQAILRFLESLRDGERLVTVENLALTKGVDGNNLSASIGGRMYMFPQAALPAAAIPSA